MERDLHHLLQLENQHLADNAPMAKKSKEEIVALSIKIL
jgi:hypothetical protein